MADTSPAPTRELIKIIHLTRHSDCQARCGITDAVVEEYAEVLEGGGSLPDPVVFQNGQTYWLADGFHTVLAHSNVDHKELWCSVHQGDKRAAILHAAGANAKHGLRRSLKDKENAVMMILKDPEWFEETDIWIADHAGVDRSLVRKLRHKLLAAKGDKDSQKWMEKWEARHQKTTRVTEPEVDENADVRTDEEETNPFDEVESDMGDSDADWNLDDDANGVNDDASDEACADAEASAVEAEAVDEKNLPRVDDGGTKLTSIELKQAFGDIRTFDDIAVRLRGIIRDVEDLGERPGGQFVPVLELKATLTKNVLQVLSARKPYRVCPSCDGEGCGQCKTAGFVHKAAYEALAKSVA